MKCPFVPLLRLASRHKLSSMELLPPFEGRHFVSKSKGRGEEGTFHGGLSVEFLLKIGILVLAGVSLLL